MSWNEYTSSNKVMRSSIGYPQHYLKNYRLSCLKISSRLMACLKSSSSSISLISGGILFHKRPPRSLIFSLDFVNLQNGWIDISYKDVWFPEFPKGITCDQSIFRWIYPDFYPRMKIDTEFKFAIRDQKEMHRWFFDFFHRLG